MSALRLLKKQELSSSVSKLIVTDCFSTEFNSYKVIFRDFRTASTSAENLYIQYVNSSGSLITTGSYNHANRYIQSSSGKTDFKATNVTSMLVGPADQEPESSGIILNIFNPMKDTAFTNHVNHSVQSGTGQGITFMGVGGIESVIPVSGIAIYPASGNIDKGTVLVYGYRES